MDALSGMDMSSVLGIDSRCVRGVVVGCEADKCEVWDVMDHLAQFSDIWPDWSHRCICGWDYQSVSGFVSSPDARDAWGFGPCSEVGGYMTELLFDDVHELL